MISEEKGKGESERKMVCLPEVSEERRTNDRSGKEKRLDERR